MEVKRMEKSIGLILTELEIRSILARRQSQLRRLAGVLKLEQVDVIWGKEWYHPSLHEDGYDEDENELVHDCPAYRATGTYRCGKPMAYDLEDSKRPGFWTAAYLMPRRFSRIRLRVKQAWREPLRDVTLDLKPTGCDLRETFAENWDMEHKKKREQWVADPLVYVVQFHLEDVS
jgi:hypothetical protein